MLSRVGDLIVFSRELPELPADFSKSEVAIVELVMRGLSNAEIARERGTTAKTVANQLYAMYRKLGVRSREELVAALARR